MCLHGRRICVEGCIWRNVYGGMYIEGCVWRDMYRGMCIEKYVWRDVCGGMCIEGCVSILMVWVSVVPIVSVVLVVSIVLLMSVVMVWGTVGAGSVGVWRMSMGTASKKPE